MGSQQYLDVMELAHLLVVDGNKSHLSQSLALHAIMYNVAQAI